MQRDDAADAVELDAVRVAVRGLAAMDDPIAFAHRRKVVMFERHLTASAIDAALRQERARIQSAMAATVEPMTEQEQEAEIERLSKLKPLAYARDRDAAADRLGMAPSMLDRLVRVEQRETDPGQGKAISLPEPEPWSKPVDGAELLSGIAAAVKRVMVMAPGSAAAVALWAVHAHALDAFMISPRLAVTSPRPQCGKTTLLDVLAHLVPRPLVMANVSSAAVYRTVEVARPTLLADEADTWLIGNRADNSLRGILNSGHRRGSSVVRVVGDDQEPRQCATWCACAIAMIGKLPATLTDRSIAVALQRKRPDEEVERFRFDRTEELDALARKAARWARDNLERLRSLDPIMPESLGNRAADNWRTLLAIADAAGGAWPKRARDIAVATVDADQGRRSGLLADIRDIFNAKKLDAISSVELVNDLVAIEGGDWSEYRDGKPLTKNTLARLLSRDGISLSTIRTRTGTLKGYKLAQFEDAFTRYLPQTPATSPYPPSQTVTPSQPAENLGIPGISETEHQDPCDGSGMSENPSFPAPCDGVTDCEPPNSPQEAEEWTEWTR